MEGKLIRIHGEGDLNFKATELRLGLPGTEESSCREAVRSNHKRALTDEAKDSCRSGSNSKPDSNATKAQIMGWPPIRSYRKNNLKKSGEEAERGAGSYVKVSMDGAPYLRKIGLKAYQGYPELVKALETMFKITLGDYSERDGYSGSEYEPTYEDKDGDWMLVGDVPWEMFLSSCRRLRIMRGSEASGL